MLRHSSHASAARACIRSATADVLIFAGVMVFVTVQASVGMSWASVSGEAAAPHALESVAAVTIGLVMVSTIGRLGGLLLPARSHALLVGCLYVAIVLGFKMPEALGTLNLAIPFSRLGPSHALPHLATASVVSLGVVSAGWWAAARHDQPRQVDGSRRWLALGACALLAVYLAIGNGEPTVGGSFRRLWAGVSGDRPNAMAYLTVVLLSVGPALWWFLDWEAGLAADADWRLLRRGSIRRWLLHEVGAGAARAAAIYVAVLATTGLAAVLRGESWGRLDDGGHLATRLLLLGVLQVAFLMLLLAVGRVSTGSSGAALGLLALLVAVGFFLAPSGVPIAQQSLALSSGDPLGIWPRAAILFLSCLLLLLALHTAGAHKVGRDGLQES